MMNLSFSFLNKFTRNFEYKIPECAAITYAFERDSTCEDSCQFQGAGTLELSDPDAKARGLSNISSMMSKIGCHCSWPSEVPAKTCFPSARVLRCPSNIAEVH
jgi:hypothetical protein